jgi:DNA repair photolyase
VLAEFRNPVGIVTKNSLVTRDVDVLVELARHQAVIVFISVTTLDPDLRKIMEPRTSPPQARLSAIETLARANVPVGVMVAPIIPAMNDHEIPSIIDVAVKAGAKCACHVTLRLPFAVAPLFEDWLTRHFPDRKEKVLNQIRSLRDGKLNDPRFGSRMKGEGVFAEQIESLFRVACRRAGIENARPRLNTDAFRLPRGNQLQLFE